MTNHEHSVNDTYQNGESKEAFSLHAHIDVCSDDETLPLKNGRKNKSGSLSPTKTYTNHQHQPVVSGTSTPAPSTSNGFHHHYRPINGTHNILNGATKQKHHSIHPLSQSATNGGDSHPRVHASVSHENRKASTAIAVSICALFLCLIVLVVTSWDAAGTNRASSTTSYDDDMIVPGGGRHLDELGRYIISDFDAKPAFSDSLPGVAGIYGKPLWSFFVNRGQAMASFGLESKQYPIQEFQSASEAYQRTPLTGFRTFLQFQPTTRRRRDNSRLLVVEPFSTERTRYDANDETLPKRTMYLGVNDMQLQEVDLVAGIETNVTYWVLPEEDFAGMIRRTTISNIDTRHSLTIGILDGLAKMAPSGGKINDKLKLERQTSEGFMRVDRPYEDTLSMPYYGLPLALGDGDATKIKDGVMERQEAGNFVLAVLENQDWGDKPLLPIVFDTSKVFGQDTLLLHPRELNTKSISDVLGGPQFGEARTSSAFAALDSVTLKPGQSVSIAAFYGRAKHLLDVPVISRRIISDGFVDFKLSRAREMIKQITATVQTRTSSMLFDKYVQQSYLQNSLRGGIPQILGDEQAHNGAINPGDSMANADEEEQIKVYHLFSRSNGDMFRDDTDFELDPTFFSQSPSSSFRDAIQHRRNDVLFNPQIGSFNIQLFLSLIQADGYAPQSVEGIVFSLSDHLVCERIAASAVGHADGHRAQREFLIGLLCNEISFRPGEVFLEMERHHVELLISRKDFIHQVAAASQWTPMAKYVDGGYETDSWSYVLDLFESYLAIYPDQEESLLFQKRLPYFISPAHVKPRSKKYVLVPGANSRQKHVVRQLNATIDRDDEKVAHIAKFADRTSRGPVGPPEAHWQHDSVDEAVFSSCILTKLLLMATLKFATRDAFGMGIEMEGGKSGWNEAITTLPARMGSSMTETFELKSLLDYIEQAIERYSHRELEDIPIELMTMIEDIERALDTYDTSFAFSGSTTHDEVPSSLFSYWNDVATAREMYREKVRLTFSGEITRFDSKTMATMIRRWKNEIEKGIDRSLSFSTEAGHHGLASTYFSFSVTKWNKTGESDNQGRRLVAPLAMKVNARYPLFLEGAVNYMKTTGSSAEAEATYQRLKSSPLKDEELEMYRISEPLGAQTELGKITAYPPGYNENQSIWMALSYKLYLQLLRHGLFEKYFQELKGGNILPFVDPNKYGRSVLECSSFLASSAFSDPAYHGRAFSASGAATAEHLNMWTLMMMGPNPFFTSPDDGSLWMQLIPSLPMWLFRSDDAGNKTIEFRLFGYIPVTYYNRQGKDLFDVLPSRYVVGLRDGTTHTIDASSVSSDLADKIRRVVFVDYIQVYFET